MTYTLFFDPALDKNKPSTTRPDQCLFFLGQKSFSLNKCPTKRRVGGDKMEYIIVIYDFSSTSSYLEELVGSLNVKTLDPTGLHHYAYQCQNVTIEKQSVESLASLVRCARFRLDIDTSR